MDIKNLYYKIVSFILTLSISLSSVVDIVAIRVFAQENVEAPYKYIELYDEGTKEKIPVDKDKIKLKVYDSNKDEIDVSFDKEDEFLKIEPDNQVDTNKEYKIAIKVLGYKVKEEKDVECYKRATEELQNYGREWEGARHENRAG